MMASQLENQNFQEAMTKSPREKIELILLNSPGSIIQTIIRKYIKIYNEMVDLLENILDIIPIKRGEITEKEIEIDKMINKVDFLTCKFVVLVPLLETQKKNSKLIEQFSELATISESFFEL